MASLSNATRRALNVVAEEDKENCTPTLLNQVAREALQANHAMTQPRPLGQRAVNPAVEMTPCMMATVMSNGQASKSAPGPRALRNITNLIDSVPKKPSKASQDDIGLILNDLCDGETAQKQHISKGKWKYNTDQAGCQAIVKLLKMDLPKDDLSKLSSPLDLFRYFERTGRLSPEVLQVFRRCPDVDTLDMCPSYGSKLNAAGLLESAPFSPRKCTVPIFKGFRSLMVLDFTNVLLSDDELRYLIHLDKVQALGLSGTKVTNRGIKYLAKHAAFKTSLKCIKLCYNAAIDVTGISFLAHFKAISEIDLLGCAKVTMRGCVYLGTHCSCLAKIRLPFTVDQRLEDLHHRYSSLISKLVQSPEECPELSDGQLRAQLKLHQAFYPNIFVNVPRSELLRRLTGILQERQIQERLFAIKY